MARKSGSQSGDLFIGESGQLRITDKSAEQRALENRKVECLGMTFDSEEARRAYFIDRLRERLAHPEFRLTPGFPDAGDEEILRLSDPPWYTACPNPFLAAIVSHSRSGDQSAPYDVPPYAADLSESRDDEIYTAHTYHTKVPPKAIARLILHYTKPGDIVLDGFCGSGMTGVAALMCGDPKLAAELGGQAGVRVPVLCDLSPAATFIASNYVRPPDPKEFLQQAETLIRTVSEEVDTDWLTSMARDASVDYVVWVEVFECPHCQRDIVSQDVLEATDNIGGAKMFSCPHCNGLVSKAPAKDSGASRLVRHKQAYFDRALNTPAERINRTPVAIRLRSGKKTEHRILDHQDRKAMQADDMILPDWYPVRPLVHGERYLLKDTLAAYGLTHTHQFYLPRQLRRMSRLWSRARATQSHRLRNALLFLVTSNSMGLTLLNRYAPTHYSQVNKQFSGTLYMPSTVAETSVRYAYANKIKRLVRAFSRLRSLPQVGGGITTQSITRIDLPDESVDYVFVDPPFGRNLQYSELNQLWEAWLEVTTQRNHEAVLDSTRGQGLPEYTALMRASFREMARVLKAGRWVTVEFHNSSNAVWMAIQEALLSAGLVVADVRVLNKERETYKQNRQGVVKRDLMISAYKVPSELEEKVIVSKGTTEVMWEFVRTHLRHLPVVPISPDAALTAEREDFLLYDRMVAFHVQRALSVPYSFAEFSAGLREKFVERDNRYFLEDQVVQYDRFFAQYGSSRQESLFVNDEASAIQWLRRELKRRPQTLQDLHPAFTREVQAWMVHEPPAELADLLAENFLQYDGIGPVPAQIHAYLSSNFKELRNLGKDDAALAERARTRWFVPDPRKQGDMEKIREKALLEEFVSYARTNEKKLKRFRTEAVRVGFKAAYERQDYRAIVSMARRLPDNVLQEDEKLLMYYDVASMRLGEE